MNKNLIVSRIKFATASLFFAAVLSTSSYAKNADNNTPVKETASAKAFNVKHVGTNDEGYVFSVKYDNVSAANFDLIIKDETGETLYQRSFSDKNFSKKFQLDKSLVKAQFIVRPAHASEQSLEVAIQSRFTEDVVISSL